MIKKNRPQLWSYVHYIDDVLNISIITKLSQKVNLSLVLTLY